MAEDTVPQKIVPYQLLYHKGFAEDFTEINRDMQDRIERAIRERLGTAPEKYGSPLRKTLKGLWKLRVGDYRVVYAVRKNDVTIYGVIHRRKVYKMIWKRL